ncbi:phage antirepressor KilAC domain-containing protein [Aeromonas caviae]|uniref:phage antirepressor KilAC domain-containing protein n=1 Tax=Aeromonas caviae TaxID=648 RepID=UPI002AB3ADC5|nr:phage antirepressor KilAC domain-containing protein [Aeromonas caviae]MDY7841586.1 phage antirepressor KilAC domain-containing protein [Aeromonas caviae]
MTIQQQYQQAKVLAGPLNSMPVIAGVEITTDEAGRFNLNALHQASGGEKKRGPSYWLALDSTAELIAEVAKTTNTEIPVFSKRGLNGGTFAHELLAISYAGWISPAFQLQVNQVFLDYRTGKLGPVTPQLTTMEILQIAMQSEQERLRLEAANHELELQVEAAKPKVEALERIAVADGSLNLTEAAKALQQQPKKFNQHLCSQRWIYKRAGGKQWLGYQDKVQQGLVEHKVTMVPLADGGERLCEQVRITPKGLTKLAQQLSVGGVQ